MVKEYVILAIIIASLFSGCIGNESIAGKYVWIKNNSSYFVLKTEGTYILSFGDGSYQNGSYAYNDNYLHLKGKTAFSDYYYTKRDNYFFNDVGGIYVKQ